MNNLLSYCGLVDGRKSAFDKDLPVPKSALGHSGYLYSHEAFASNNSRFRFKFLNLGLTGLKFKSWMDPN